MRANFDISNSPQLPDIGQNSDGGISDFWISGQSFIKESCHNSRTSDDIDMKLGRVTNLDKGNQKTSKRFDDDIILNNCDAIATFSDLWPIWSNPEARFRRYSLQNLHFQKE